MKETDHSQREHAKLSPSRLKSAEICPGHQSDKHAEPHPVTEAGTRMHEVLESVGFIDRGLDSRHIDGLADPEERRLVWWCWDQVAPYVDRFPTYENEICLDVVDGMWGFADHVRFNKDRTMALLVDYKFGFNLQEPVQTNPAAQAYCLGLFKANPNLEQISVQYLYPRHDYVSKFTYHGIDSAQLELRVQTILDRANAAQPELNPTVDNCKWCGAKATCPALAKMVLPIATKYADSHERLSLPIVREPSEITDPEDMGKALQVAEVMAEWCGSVKKHALRLRQDEGQEIPGYELAQRKGRRKVVDPVNAFDVVRQLGVTQDEFLAATEVSVTKLNDAIRKHAPRGSKKNAVEQAENELFDRNAMEQSTETFYLKRLKG